MECRIRDARFRRRRKGVKTWKRVGGYGRGVTRIEENAALTSKRGGGGKTQPPCCLVRIRNRSRSRAANLVRRSPFSSGPLSSPLFRVVSRRLLTLARRSSTLALCNRSMLEASSVRSLSGPPGRDRVDSRDWSTSGSGASDDAGILRRPVPGSPLLASSSSPSP